MKPQRNDPCPCGSGKKYKKCCGQAEADPAVVRTGTMPALDAQRYNQTPQEPLDQQQMAKLVALLNAGRYRDLEVLALSLTGSHPQSAFAWKALGLALGRQGKDSIVALQRAVQLAPRDAEAHNNLGSALRRSGQLDAALASCEQALLLKPDFAEAINNRGNVLLDLQRI